MGLGKYFAATAAAVTMFTAGAANAALIYVGSWIPHLDIAESWSESPPNGPLAYTGVEAAALLFGGNASDYQISTAGRLVDDINNLTWYDVIGFGGRVFAQDYNSKYLGQFYGPTDGYSCDTCTADNNAASAFIRDNGVSGRNYAFRDDSLGPVTPIEYGVVPEPATWALMIGGFGMAGAMIRRRRVAATA